MFSEAETVDADPARPGEAASLPWVQVAPGAPYSMTEAGEPWHPVCHNDGRTCRACSGGGTSLRSTRRGEAVGTLDVAWSDGRGRVDLPPLRDDLALAIGRR